MIETKFINHKYLQMKSPRLCRVKGETVTPRQEKTLRKGDECAYSDAGTLQLDAPWGINVPHDSWVSGTK